MQEIEPEFYWAESLDRLIDEVKPAREALIEGFIYKKSSHMIYAPDGCGKSLLALQAVMQGTVDNGKVFGEMNVPVGFNTLFIQAERPVDEPAERLKRMKSKTPFDSKKFILTTDLQGTNLRNEKSAEKALEKIHRMIELSFKTVDLVVIDPIYALVRGGIKDDEAASYVNEFSRIIQKTYDCSVLWVHHANRGTRDKETGGRVGEDMFGSRFLSAHCTGVYKLTLNPDQNGTTFELEKTSHKNLDKKIDLIYDPESDLSWVKQSSGSISKVDRLYNYLRTCRQNDKEFTFRDMQDNSRVSDAYLRELMSRHLHSELKICGKTKYGGILYKYAAEK